MRRRRPDEVRSESLQSGADAAADDRRGGVQEAEMNVRLPLVTMHESKVNVRVI